MTAKKTPFPSSFLARGGRGREKSRRCLCAARGSFPPPHFNRVPEVRGKDSPIPLYTWRVDFYCWSRFPRFVQSSGISGPPSLARAPRGRGRRHFSRRADKGSRSLDLGRSPSPFPCIDASIAPLFPPELASFGRRCKGRGGVRIA